jgi:hypothetical protein
VQVGLIHNLDQLLHLAVAVAVQIVELPLELLVALVVEVEETEAPLVEMEIHPFVVHPKAVMEALEALPMYQVVVVVAHLL